MFRTYCVVFICDLSQLVTAIGGKPRHGYKGGVVNFQ